MIDSLKTKSFLDYIDPSKTRVYQPTHVCFVCGGEAVGVDGDLKSLRHAFMRICHDKPFEKYKFLLFEDITRDGNLANYRDFLKLETDLSYLSSIIVMFSESFGTAVELGAFSVIDEICEKIFVVIDNKNYEAKSFVTHGPLRRISESQGEGSIFVINPRDIGLDNINYVSKIDRKIFAELIGRAIDERIKRIASHSSFDKNNRGHIAKLIVALVQWYGALTVEEIAVCLLYFDLKIADEDVENLTCCAERVGWLFRERRGTTWYLFPAVKKMAAQFHFVDDTIKKDAWMLEVRAEWKKLDTLRFNAMADLASRMD